MVGASESLVFVIVLLIAFPLLQWRFGGCGLLRGHDHLHGFVVLGGYGFGYGTMVLHEQSTAEGGSDLVRTF